MQRFLFQSFNNYLRRAWLEIIDYFDAPALHQILGIRRAPAPRQGGPIAPPIGPLTEILQIRCPGTSAIGAIVLPYTVD